MDPNNPVVQLCMKGMEAESEGRPDDARTLFLEAWEARTDDYDACIAAHFLARHQPTPQDTFYWNEQALNYAAAVGDERVRAFYPSLYLNMGYSHELLGDMAEAGKYYDMAAQRMDDIPDGRYKNIVSNGISNGQQRME